MCSASNPHCVPYLTPPQVLGFETLTASFYSLSMLLTSTNFPDVALPAYKGNRASMLFFISFQARAHVT